jgi:hypothetical protein
MLRDNIDPVKGLKVSACHPCFAWRVEKAVDHSGRVFEMNGFSTARDELPMSVEVKCLAAAWIGVRSPIGGRLPANRT